MTQFLKRTNVEALSSWILDESVKAGAAAVDVLYSEGSSSKLSLIDGEVEESVSGLTAGIGIRTIMSDGRQGIAYGNNLNRSSIKELIEWSMANCRNAEPEEGVALYTGELVTDSKIAVEDPLIAEITAQNRMDYCMEMNNYAKSLNKHIISVRNAAWQDGSGSSFYCTTTGLAGWESGSRASCGVVVLARDGASTEIGGYGDEFGRLADLDIKFIAAEAVKKTVDSLGATSIKTGTYTVVIERETAASLVEIIGDLFCAPEIHKGRSMMKDRLGTAVASSCVTLIDDGRVPWKAGTSSWDSEGVPTANITLIKDGIASSYLYNLQYAWKDGVRSTGNASRGLSSLPDVATTNLILQAGKESREGLILNVREGLYITEFMGLHTIDTVSGDFSIGAKGLMIENGVLTHAVSGVTIASNLMELIKNITMVGSDLKYFGSIAAPTLVVENVVIAGE